MERVRQHVEICAMDWSSLFAIEREVLLRSLSPMAVAHPFDPPSLFDCHIEGLDAVASERGGREATSQTNHTNEIN